MASPRYTLNINDNEPQPEKHVMTRKEKRENFWFYYKWHIVAFGVAAAMIFSFAYEIITKIDPDYTIGVISPYPLPQDAKAALEAHLCTLADDRNGDGKAVVVLSEYNFAPPGDNNIADPNIFAANATRMMGDIQTGESMMFLTYDVKSMYENYGIFAYNDGNAPSENEEPDFTRMGIPWSQCPLLSSADLGDIYTFEGLLAGNGQDAFKNMYLVKRAFRNTSIENKKGMADYYQSSMDLYDKLTRG